MFSKKKNLVMIFTCLSIMLNGCTNTPTSPIGSSNYHKVPQQNQSPQTLDYFYEIALGSEYGNGAKTIKKWSSHIYVLVKGQHDQPPSTEDAELIQQTLEKINLELPETTQFILTTNPQKAKLIMYVVPRSQFNAILQENYGHNYSHVNSNYNGFVSISSYNNIIIKGTILIGEDLSLKKKKHVLLEETTQAIGLLNDSMIHKDSIFYNGASLTDTYATVDKKLIKILYDPTIAPGMTQYEIQTLYN